MPSAACERGIESGQVMTYRALVRRPVQKGGLVQQHRVESVDHAAGEIVDGGRARDGESVARGWWSLGSTKKQP